MSLFALTPPSGAFAPCGGTNASLAFTRKVWTQNSAAELVLSFVSTITATFDLQPETGKFPRYLHGQLAEIHFSGVIFGNADVQEGDRTTVSGAPIEIVNTRHYGVDVTEIDLSWVR